MLKILLLGVIITMIYRFWDTNPKKEKNIGQELEEPAEYAEYEELDNEDYNEIN